jgi:succinate-acetate transporter protein
MALPTRPEQSPAVLNSETANPAPLGMAALALTLFLFSIYNIGWLDTGTSPGRATIWISMAVLYGGIVMFAAGMWELRDRNTIGATAYSSLGAFWVGVGVLDQSFGMSYGNLGWYFVSWLIFTALIAIVALRINGATAAVFALFTVTLIFLWIGAAANEDAGHGVRIVAGIVGLITAVVAWYTTLAAMLSLVWGRDLLPVFPVSPAVLDRVETTATDVGGRMESALERRSSGPEPPTTPPL